jgi:hypothetical protein
MTENNKPTEYCLSPANTPKDQRGTPASDLRAVPIPETSKESYNTAAPVNPLREQLREAEIMYRYKHAKRKKKLFLKLFWIIFAIYAVCVSISVLAGYISITLVDSLLMIGASALMSIPAAAVTALVFRWIIIAGYTSAFAGDAEELQHIEHLKDLMCQ